MSMYLVNRIWNDTNSDLTNSEKSILLREASFAKNDGTSIFPSLSRLARESKLSRRQVIRIVQSLQKKGFLIKVKESDRANHKATEYRINLDMIKIGKVVKFQPHKLSTNPVDKSVHNQCTVNLSSDMVSPPPSDMVSPYSLLRTVNHDHEVKTVKKFELIERLINMNVNKQHAMGWIDYFGCDKIEAELSLMDKRADVKNPGGYFRRMVQSNFDRRGDADMARFKKDDYPIPTVRETDMDTLKVFRPDAKRTEQVAKSHLTLIKNVIDCVRFNEKDKTRD